MEDNKIIVEELKNTGLIVAPFSETVYHSHAFQEQGLSFGGVLSPIPSPDIIFPTGYGWKQVLLDLGHPELQFNTHFDTYSCVLFGIAKQICCYAYKVYGIKYTIDEMYLALLAGVRENSGTTVEAGMEAPRKNGWVPDGKYPNFQFNYDMTASQYFNAVLPKYIILDGQTMAGTDKSIWEFHWKVIPNNLQSIFEAYKRYPVGLTVFAWASYFGTGVYFDYNNQPNHYCIGLEPSVSGKNNLIGDNYPKDFQFVENSQIGVGDLIKELDSSFKYGSATVCWLTPLDTKKKISIIKFMKDFYYFWDGNGHNFYRIGVPAGQTEKYRQKIDWKTMTDNEKMIFLALRDSMNQSSWAEVSKFQDIAVINKSFV